MENYDVFISYRRSGGRDVARLLYKELESRGIKCFFDFNSLRSGMFDENIYKAIESCRYFVLVVTDGAFDRCVRPDDWVRMEVEYALKHSKEIVPIAPSDQLQYFPEVLPESMAVLKNRQISELNMGRLFEKSVDLIIEDRFGKEYVSTHAGAKEDNADGLPVLGKAVDEVTMTALTGKDAEHFKKAMGYYRVLRRRSALKELQAIENKDDPIVRYYVARFLYELDGTVSDADFEATCRDARELGCADAMVAFAEKHMPDTDKAVDAVSPTECVEWLRKAIAKGSAEALATLSSAYANGNGVRKDLVLVRALLKRASDANNMSGRLAYGVDLLMGNYGEKDVGKAVELLRPLIKHLQEYEDELTAGEYMWLVLYLVNNPFIETDSALACTYCRCIVESKGHLISDDASVKAFAHYVLGLNLLNDDSNPGNARLAFKNFQKAYSIGNQGHGELGLANCYLAGIGVKQDEEKAWEYYKQASAKGNSEAQRLLALYYLDTTEYQNKERGKALLKMAADGGDSEATYLYGLGLISGQYFDKNVAEGMKWLEKAAVQDCDAGAMNSLGNQYYNGNDVVEKDFEKAFDWFKRGAEAGSAEAMESLGIAYLNGTGTIPDVEEAERWLIKAAENGNVSAMNKLAVVYVDGDFGGKNVAKAIEWWVKAAEHENGGDSYAMINLGRTYRDGAEGVEKDIDKALEWFIRAANAGNKFAACELGAGYYNGIFGKPDIKLALKWWQKAAKLGDATAMNNIGEMYRDGEVGEVDLDKAIDWFTRAANCESPNADAMYNLGEACLEGKGVGKDVKEAEKWYCKAADTGDSVAEAVLGTKYYNGDFGEPNYKEAKKWWERASEHGNSTAMFKLATSYRDGDFGEKDTAQWIYWVERSIDNGNAEAMEAYAIYLLENGEEEKCRELLEKSAENGNASAMCSLGTRFFNGDFGGKNVAKAIEWWVKAAEHENGGDSIAMVNLGTTYYYGDEGVEKNLDKALEWLTKAVDAGNGNGCCLLGLHYLSLLDKDFATYEKFAESITESFVNEQARIRAMRKAKGMFNKAITSDDSDATGWGHLLLARLAKLQGDEETANTHYAKAAKLGREEEHTSSSLFSRILDSVSFLKKKSKQVG